jgi:uncharacterized protein (TIGR02588 family)
MARDEDNERRDEGKRQTGTSMVEWAAATAGAILLFGTISYMTYYGVTRPDGPPKIALLQGSIEGAPGGYVVEFTARNNGHRTAATLKVTGQLLDGKRVIEESEATLDYVPEQSERVGGLFFTQDPSEHQVRLRSEGYSAP